MSRNVGQWKLLIKQGIFHLTLLYDKNTNMVKQDDFARKGLQKNKSDITKQWNPPTDWIIGT